MTAWEYALLVIDRVTDETKRAPVNPPRKLPYGVELPRTAITVKWQATWYGPDGARSTLNRLERFEDHVVTLNRAGADGWELTSASEDRLIQDKMLVHTRKARYIFKRPAPTSG